MQHGSNLQKLFKEESKKEKNIEIYIWGYHVRQARARVWWSHEEKTALKSNGLNWTLAKR